MTVPSAPVLQQHRGSSFAIQFCELVFNSYEYFRKSDIGHGVASRERQLKAQLDIPPGIKLGLLLPAGESPRGQKDLDEETRAKLCDPGIIYTCRISSAEALAQMSRATASVQREPLDVLPFRGEEEQAPN